MSVRDESAPPVRVFYLYREEDASGVSGTGMVAHGVEFQDGKCVLWWPNYGSVGVYDNREQVAAIHGHGGKTKIYPASLS